MTFPFADSSGRLSIDTCRGAAPLPELELNDDEEPRDVLEVLPLDVYVPELDVSVAPLVTGVPAVVPAPTGHGPADAASCVPIGGAVVDSAAATGRELERPRSAMKPPATSAPIVALSAAAASIGRHTLGGGEGGGGTLDGSATGGGIVLGIIMRGSGSGGGGGRTVVRRFSEAGGAGSVARSASG